MKVSHINKFEREPDIWLIARTLREKLAVIPHLKSIEVTHAGGSPMKSIRGSVDVMLSANSVDKLEAMREDIESVLYKTKGLISIANTWEYDKEVLKLEIDEAKALEYGLTNDMISREIQMLVRGGIVLTLG